MHRFAVVSVVVLVVAGCKTRNVEQVGPEAREAITYAARAKYPGNATTAPSVQFVGLDDRKAKEITIFNLTSNTVPARAVWVNGSYVATVGEIGPKGHAAVKYTQLLESGASTRDLGMTGQFPSRVEVETAQGLVPVVGPAVRF